MMEPFYDQYKDTLDELNKCAKSFGVTVWGNIFYLQNGTEMVKSFVQKRSYFCEFAFEVDCIVEIGFNAGHSAMLGLTANDDVVYRSIDFGQQYTEACYHVLKNRFGDRISLTIGDSADVLPIIKEIYPEIDTLKTGWFIDGDHSYEYFKKDMTNVLNLAKQGDLIFLDDTNQVSIIKALNEYFSQNLIRLVKKGNSCMVVTKA